MKPPVHRPRARMLLQVGLVLLLATVVRLLGWRSVFRPDGVYLAADSDPHYHVLQAERFIRAGLQALWHDPNLDWPLGAAVPWPPLFDTIIATAARALHGGAVDRLGLEQVASVVPVALGVVTVGLLASLAACLLGPGRSAGAALLLAVLPAHVLYSVVGRADQHVAEILVSCWVQLGFVTSWAASTARTRRAAVAATAVGLASGFWIWMGSGFNLVLPVAFGAAAHVLLEDRELVARIARSLLSSLAWAAALLAATLAAWGPPGALRHGDLQGLTGLQVALLAAGASSGGLLLLLGARPERPRPAVTGRLLEAAAALAVPVAALVLTPGLRGGVLAGLTALGAANPWYEDIAEFRPLLFSCHTPISSDVDVALRFYGLALPAALLALPALLRRWEDRRERARVLFLLLWSATFLVFALARRRFAPYLAVPLALLAWEGIRATSAWTATRWFGGRRAAGALLTVVGVTVVVAPSLPGVLGASTAHVPDGHVQATRWLGTQRARPGAEGVLGSWELGHLVQYYSGKPVLVTPFGTEGGPGAMETAARFDLADPGAIDALLRDRRIGWVALLDPVVRARMDKAFVGAASPLMVSRECSFTQGKLDSLTPDFLDLAAPRLYYFDGLAAPERAAPSIGGLRLVYESPPDPAAEGGPSDQLKIFGVVLGARVDVSGLAPAQPLRATVELRTNQGRVLAWSTVATADEHGRAHLRLPYATGPNGAIEARPWVLDLGSRQVALRLSEREVIDGEAVGVRLAEDAAAPRGGEPAAR